MSLFSSPEGPTQLQKLLDFCYSLEGPTERGFPEDTNLVITTGGVCTLGLVSGHTKIYNQQRTHSSPKGKSLKFGGTRETEIRPGSPVIGR